MTNNYLEGLVEVYTIPKDADKEGRFKNGDSRGEVAMIIANENIEHLEYAEFSDSKIKRGFHFHKKYTEKLYVLKGSLILAIANSESTSQLDIKINSGDLVTIHPTIAHAFFSLEPTLVLSMGYNGKPFEDRFLYSAFSFSQYE